MDSTTSFQPWTTGDSSKNVKTEEVVDDAKLHRENVNHPKHTQTASYDKESVTATSNAPGPSNTASSSGVSPSNTESKMDSGKITSMQQIVENTLSQESRQRVTQLLEAVEALTGAERLLLYLRLPTGIPVHDPLKQPVNPLGSRAELQQTVTWIQTHLEVDPDVSLPKQDVYDEYIAHCMSSNMKPLSTADFGKVMKQVYPSVRPRRLGTRGNSRYCYAGLRKKVKLEVPQLPDLGESSKETNVPVRETERIVCDWAETKLGLKFSTLSELSRHVVSLGTAQHAPPRLDSGTPPPQSHATVEETANRQMLKTSIKRKIQTQGTPGRPKKNKSQELVNDSPPSTSYGSHLSSMKHESEVSGEASAYGYQAAYAPPVYEPRPPFAYVPPTPLRPHPPLPSHPTHALHPPPPPHPSLALHEYRPDPYVYESPYAPRDFTQPPDTAYNIPINLSSDASLDLSTERTEWQRRKPPEPPPARLPLPGKKLILETYQSKNQTSSVRSTQMESRPIPHTHEEFPQTEYLPKKMRAAEILGGKLAAARQSLVPPEPASSSSSTGQESTVRSDVSFLEDPKNATSRSKSTAAALAREEQEAASPTVGEAPTPTSERTKQQKSCNSKETSPHRLQIRKRGRSPDSCCGLDGINIKTGMICQEKHSEILNRERVISICNIDKHDLDDYLNEGNSQEHEEELLQYFHHRGPGQETSADPNAPDGTVAFLEAGLDPQEDHSQSKNEKISQLRELLAKNLKSQRWSSSQDSVVHEKLQLKQPHDNSHGQADDISDATEGGFKPVLIDDTSEPVTKSIAADTTNLNNHKHCNSIPDENSVYLPFNNNENGANQVMTNMGGQLYNGNSHNVPQSPTTRTQQYDFVPISDECHSPGNFSSKSPLGFVQRGHSPSKINKSIVMSSSLQTSPISHSTAASPFVSPRNTPVPRSRLCPRPIPKHNGRRRRNLPSLGVNDPCSKQFAIPSKASTMCGSVLKYSQPMSAPPSPNILSSQFKNQVFMCNTGLQNGNAHLNLNFLPHTSLRDQNGEISQPLSADPLSSEVSQFFQEPIVNYNRMEHDTSFRSQSVPLKPGINIGLLSYNNTPAGSVPPTPVPNEFCDFGSLADTCDISKAGLNPETLDKIYHAIDSSNDVLNADTTQNILNPNDDCNGCDQLPQQQMLADEINSLISSDTELLARSNQFNQSFGDENCATTDNVEDFLKRANSIEFNFSEMETEKNKYYTSRSVPSTPLPYKRSVPNLQIESRRQRELFTSESFYNGTNSISSKSVPSTPQLVDENTVFNYNGNRDFLINGNSLEVCGATQMHGNIVDDNQGLTSPLHILHDEMTEPLTPAADLLADLDKIDSTPYDDL